jgi:hypothetical protein
MIRKGKTVMSTKGDVVQLDLHAAAAHQDDVQDHREPVVPSQSLAQTKIDLVNAIPTDEETAILDHRPTGGKLLNAQDRVPDPSESLSHQNHRYAWRQELTQFQNGSLYHQNHR